MFGFVKKSVIYRINNFIKFYEHKFIELFFSEQSRM